MYLLLLLEFPFIRRPNKLHFYCFIYYVAQCFEIPVDLWYRFNKANQITGFKQIIQIKILNVSW